MRAAEKGWGFGDPVGVSLRRGWFGQNDRYEIETMVGYRGTKCRFTVDATTGEITQEGYVPL